MSDARVDCSGFAALRLLQRALKQRDSLFGRRPKRKDLSLRLTFGASAPNSPAMRSVAGHTRVEKRKPEGKAFRDFVLKAGEGIRTLDIHLGKVTLYH